MCHSSSYCISDFQSNVNFVILGHCNHICFSYVLKICTYLINSSIINQLLCFNTNKNTFCVIWKRTICVKICSTLQCPIYF